MLQSPCHGKVDGTVPGVILFRLTENSILMNEISEKTWNKELNKLLPVKIQFRENCIWMNTRWRPRIQSEEIQNTHYSSHNESLNLKDNNYWKLIRVSSTWERIYLCSRMGMKDHLHKKSYARMRREIEELKRRCYQEEDTERTEDWKNFLRSIIRNHEQWVYSLTILTYWEDMTYLRSSSSSYHLEFKKA